MHGGKGFGGGEATRDPEPTAYDPNDPKGKQQAIHKAESFADYLARRGGASRSAALIIQNKGGGHGEIGYHLALQLAGEKKMDVTILQEGPNKGKPPHNAYGDLDMAGVKVHWCDSLDDPAACIGRLGSARFTAVIDNWSKSPEQIRPYAEFALSMSVTNYCYVSSAGMYKPETDDIVDETCPCKQTGQREAELLLAQLGLPYSYFRPQYIYGPKQGKSYLAYFFDRIVRSKPVFVPNDGSQSVTMTHAADNAAMIAAAIGNPRAVGEAFNCATTILCTYDELVGYCAAAAGKEATICHYNPVDFESGITKAMGFPFRETAFFVSAHKASELLGFAPKHDLKDDAAWYYLDNYKAQGGEGKQVDFSADETIDSKVGMAVHAQSPAQMSEEEAKQAWLAKLDKPTWGHQKVPSQGGTADTELPKLYVYDHCPFCVRVRLALGLVGLKHQLVFMGNDDIMTPTKLVGKKIAPIWEDDDGPMGESLDIIDKIDVNRMLKPASGRTDLKKWQKSVQTIMRKLQRPRYVKVPLPEFMQRDGRDAFVRNHQMPPYEKAEWKGGALRIEAKYEKYEEAFKESAELVPQLSMALFQLEPMIFCREYCTEGGLSLDDIDLWARLRSITLIKGLFIPPKIRAYLDHFESLGDVPLYDTMAI